MILSNYLQKLEINQLIENEKMQLPLFKDLLNVGLVELSVNDLGVGLAPQYQFFRERTNRKLTIIEEKEYAMFSKSPSIFINPIA